MKLSLVGKGMKKRLSSRRGQNTVEYLLMLTVVVGLALVVGAFLKNKMPGVMSGVIDKITGATNSLGSSGGSNP
ncbi:MAG: hypothetical protein KGJ84_05480 [Elusimicrobia bacterium]|nr:hypothetical protein [Elusimicrobiota bacterium]